MIQLLKNILGIGSKVDLADLVKNGAQIIDVRTKGEYQGGHIRGSVNIPIQKIVNPYISGLSEDWATNSQQRLYYQRKLLNKERKKSC